MTATLEDRDHLNELLRDVLLMDPASVRAEILSGGVSSSVIRVTSPDGCVVVKQALPKLRVAADWFSRPDRSAIEARCAMVLERLVPGSVPRTVHVDADRHAFVMACAPEGSETWKSRLLRGTVEEALAEAAGDLLGRIHGRAREEPELARAFGDRSFFEELRISPYIEHAADRNPDLSGPLGDVAERLRDPGTTLVHGDFSPKNLLVSPDGAMLLVDHEVAHWGNPAFDVAFVLSHLVLKAVNAGDRRLTGAARVFVDRYALSSGMADVANGPFTSSILGTLLLARVDGKSPVEYLDSRGRRTAKELARHVLLERPGRVHDVLDAVEARLP